MNKSIALQRVPLVCGAGGGVYTAPRVGLVVRRGGRSWLVRVYNGANPETKTIHSGLRDAQAHLNKMLGERDRGRNLDSSKQALNQ